MSKAHHGDTKLILEFGKKSSSAGIKRYMMVLTRDADNAKGDDHFHLGYICYNSIGKVAVLRTYISLT